MNQMDLQFLTTNYEDEAAYQQLLKNKTIIENTIQKCNKFIQDGQTIIHLYLRLQHYFKTLTSTFKTQKNLHQHLSKQFLNNKNKIIYQKSDQNTNVQNKTNLLTYLLNQESILINKHKQNLLQYQTIKCQIFDLIDILNFCRSLFKNRQSKQQLLLRLQSEKIQIDKAIQFQMSQHDTQHN